MAKHRINNKEQFIDDETVVFSVYYDAIKIDSAYLYLNTNNKINKSVLLNYEYDAKCNKENNPQASNKIDEYKDEENSDDDTEASNGTRNFISYSELKKILYNDILTQGS